VEQRKEDVDVKHQIGDEEIAGQVFAQVEDQYKRNRGLPRPHQLQLFSLQVFFHFVAQHFFQILHVFVVLLAGCENRL